MKSAHTLYFTFFSCPRILRPEKQGCECYCELALTLYRLLFTSEPSMNIQPSRRHCLFCFTSMGSCCLSSQSLYDRQKHTGEDPLCFQQLQYWPSFLSNANTLYCTSELISVCIFTNRWEIWNSRCLLAVCVTKL